MILLSEALTLAKYLNIPTAFFVHMQPNKNGNDKVEIYFSQPDASNYFPIRLKS